MDLGSVSSLKTKKSCVVHELRAFCAMMQNSDLEKKVKMEKMKMNIKVESRDGKKSRSVENIAVEGDYQWSSSRSGSRMDS